MSMVIKDQLVQLITVPGEIWNMALSVLFKCNKLTDQCFSLFDCFVGRVISTAPTFEPLCTVYERIMDGLSVNALPLPPLK